jgi:hypothetical protein
MGPARQFQAYNFLKGIIFNKENLRSQNCYIDQHQPRNNPSAVFYLKGISVSGKTARLSKFAMSTFSDLKHERPVQTLKDRVGQTLGNLYSQLLMAGMNNTFFYFLKIKKRFYFYKTYTFFVVQNHEEILARCMPNRKDR